MKETMKYLFLNVHQAPNTRGKVLIFLTLVPITVTLPSTPPFPEPRPTLQPRSDSRALVRVPGAPREIQFTDTHTPDDR